MIVIVSIVGFILFLGLISSVFAQSDDLGSVLDKAQESLNAENSSSPAQSSNERMTESTAPIQEKPSNTYMDEKCGVSIVLPKGWKALASQFVFEDKSKTLADFQSPNDDILNLQHSIENIGLAKRSPQDISRLERETASLADSTILSTDTGMINGFPSYKTVYSQGSVGKYELQKDKFHNMDILIIAHNREYRLTYEAADKVEFDKYQSTIEDMAQTIKISEPNFEGINCQTAGPVVSETDGQASESSKGVARCPEGYFRNSIGDCEST